MFENYRGLSESQRRSTLMDGVWLTPGQQLVQAAFGGMDEVSEAIGDDGRDLTGATAADPKLRRTPNCSAPLRRVKRDVAGEANRWRAAQKRREVPGPSETSTFSYGGDLLFRCGPTHVESREGVNFSTPEAILIAAETGDTEDAICALGNDPLKQGVPTAPAPVQRRHVINRAALQAA